MDQEDTEYHKQVFNRHGQRWNGCWALAGQDRRPGWAVRAFAGVSSFGGGSVDL